MTRTSNEAVYTRIHYICLVINNTVFGILEQFIVGLLLYTLLCKIELIMNIVHSYEFICLLQLYIEIHVCVVSTLYIYIYRKVNPHIYLSKKINLSLGIINHCSVHHQLTCLIQYYILFCIQVYCNIQNGARNFQYSNFIYSHIHTY